MVMVTVVMATVGLLRLSILIQTARKLSSNPPRGFVEIYPGAFVFGCSNVAKLSWKNIYIFLRKEYVWFSKNLFFSKKSYLFKINIWSPFNKFNSVKKNFLCKKNHSLKQTYSVKHEFSFQFSFATNEQV